VTYGNDLFVAVSARDDNDISHVMTSDTMNAPPALDPANDPPLVIVQALPVAVDGTCSLRDGFAVSYGTGLSGGWILSWKPWVDTTIGADGQRIGGWGCMRTLINGGGQTRTIAN